MSVLLSFIFIFTLLQICMAQTCPPNSHYEDCPFQQPTCTSLTYSALPDYDCTGRCVCDSGFIDDGNGICIPTESCPQIGQCQGNRTLYTCHFCSTYETTCTTIGLYPPCVRICTVGCFCPSGYVLNDGVCIPPQQCCEPNGYLPDNCITAPCECICKPGYTRDENNRCVSDCGK